MPRLLPAGAGGPSLATCRRSPHTQAQPSCASWTGKMAGRQRECALFAAGTVAVLSLSPLQGHRCTLPVACGTAIIYHTHVAAPPAIGTMPPACLALSFMAGGMLPSCPSTCLPPFASIPTPRRLYMVQEPGAVDPVQVELEHPSDADKFVPGALLRVTGTRPPAPPGQQKPKRIKGKRVEVLSGGDTSTSGGEEPLPLKNQTGQAQPLTAGTIQQLAVKLGLMKILVVPRKLARGGV